MNEKNLPDFNELWDFDNPAATAIKFRELLPLAESSANPDYHAQLLTQIARTEGLQMNFDEAHKILDNAEKIITGDMPLARVRYFLERGRTYNSSKVYDKAKKLFLDAYKLSDANNFDRYTIDAAHMMGIVEKGEESLRWNEIAMKHAEKSTDEKARLWLGSLYNNTGWIYHDMGEFDKALDLFEKNVLWHTNRNTKRGLIIAKWCVARTMRSLNRVQEAYDKQVDLNIEIVEKGMEQDGYIFEEMGECLLLLNRKEEAKPNFARAYGMLSKDIWLVENEKQRLIRLKNLSE